MGTVSDNSVDIKENDILQRDAKLLDLLLLDRTTGKNIKWATHDYANHGEDFLYGEEIRVHCITRKYGRIIRPRVSKSLKEQRFRVRNKAEVFTPSWLCNSQNNLVDEAWFGRKGVFNTESENNWITNTSKIEFSDTLGKRWQDYIFSRRLEIACGEAPYLVSRYDNATGKSIPVSNRIGILDRKLRVVSENTSTCREWYKWANYAYKSVYGYEWQGDNLLLARENLLFTFMDFFQAKFGRIPAKKETRQIANIISWNVWQMDGLKCVVPDTCRTVLARASLCLDGGPADKYIPCPGCESNNIHLHNGIYCRIRDWDTHRIILFKNLINTP